MVEILLRHSGPILSIDSLMILSESMTTWLSGKMWTVVHEIDSQVKSF